jgi:hypothetical protein
MDTQKQQTKPKKKAVKRKPRKKPAVKKSITQKQSVTQNVKVIVGELKQRRRQERSLFHKQPQRQYQQPPTIIYQQAPVQQVAPQSITPQPQPQQPQPQQQTAPITQPTPSPLTQPTAPPQASPVTPTIPTPPPPIQPQTTPPPTIPIPVVPSIEPQDRTVTRPTSPVDPLTRPAPSLSLMGQIQQKAKERADRASTDALTQPPETSRPRPVQALSLQEQIQQKAKERQERVNLGDERKTEVPKGKGSLTSTLPPPKMDLMAEILKKGKDLKPTSSRPKTTLPPPKPDEKTTMVDLMKSKMKGRRIGIGSDSDDDDDEIGAFSVAGELPKKEIITPEIVTVTAKPLLQASKEDKTTLDDLTTPKPKGGVYKLDGTFIRGSTTGRNIGIPKEAEEAFNEYVTKHSKTKVKNSSSSGAVNGKITTKEMQFKNNKGYIEDFNKLLALTGDTARGLEGKLKRANQGKPPKFV